SRYEKSSIMRNMILNNLIFRISGLPWMVHPDSSELGREGAQAGRTVVLFCELKVGGIRQSVNGLLSKSSAPEPQQVQCANIETDFLAGHEQRCGALTKQPPQAVLVQTKPITLEHVTGNSEVSLQLCLHCQGMHIVMMGCNADIHQDRQFDSP